MLADIVPLRNMTGPSVVDGGCRTLRDDLATVKIGWAGPLPVVGAPLAARDYTAFAGRCFFSQITCRRQKWSACCAGDRTARRSFSLRRLAVGELDPARNLLIPFQRRQFGAVVSELLASRRRPKLSGPGLKPKVLQVSVGGFLGTKRACVDHPLAINQIKSIFRVPIWHDHM